MDAPGLATPHTLVLRPARPARAQALSSAIVVPLFATTLFVGGFLLFLVEPMVAKMVLPIFGGAPMVWNGCVTFFQVMLLAGYGYAYGASKWLRLRQHVFLHVALLLLPAAVLPFMIQPGAAAPQQGNPLLGLVLLLAASIGLPFFVLSTTASVLQHWLSKTDHPAGRDPYFLYAASNFGCLAALTCYPIVVEPLLTLRQQSRLWSIGYAEFVALAGACAVFAWRRANTATDDATAISRANLEVAVDRLTLARRVRWVALAFVPSSLMLAVTSYMSTDIAPVPLLWIVPLALYLLTFALAFGRRSTAVHRVARLLFPLAVVPLAIFMIAGVQSPLVTIVSLHLLAFGGVALYCHSQLAHDRPTPLYLTEFYFWLSLGGMFGGLFNTLVAPLLFNSILEYPLIVALACLLFRPTDGRVPSRRSTLDAIMPVVVGAATVGVFVGLGTRYPSLAVLLTLLSVPAIIAFTQRRSVRFGYCMAAMLLAGIAFGDGSKPTLYATRTFFGVHRVRELWGGRYHGLVHGTTVHGMQSLAPERRHEALTYFHATGPFGQAFEAISNVRHPRQVAVVGLGAGTLATYAQPGQHWTFFEIDRAVERIARTTDYFSYMDACGDRCSVVIGDARQSLARAPDSAYDLLVLDAFSSDSIPMHLMTREALSLYLSRLAPGGALIMHVSNRHLRLAPVLARLAASHGLVAMEQNDERDLKTMPEGKQPSHWVVMARSRADLGALNDDARWSALMPSPSIPLWTDDFSNILSVLDLH